MSRKEVITIEINDELDFTPDPEMLEHYGVLGMKWGVRKDRVSNAIKKARSNESDYRNKLTNIQEQYKKTGMTRRGKSDLRRINYRNRSYATRVGETITSTIVATVIQDVLIQKNRHKYETMTTKKAIKELSTIAGNSIRNVAKWDALAKSASKNYDSDGKLKSGMSTETRMTKQDVIDKSVRLGVAAVPLARWAAKKKLSQVVTEKRANEARFKAWGSNILPEKVNNVIWQSDDLNSAVIDNMPSNIKKVRR